MGQHNSNFELASEARRAAERFDECEIKVIKETFKDLCHLNGGSMRIDKETFLQYLPLPGLLGERLFAVFDKKCSGEIDYEEFVCGLAVTCRGTWEEKVEFIFNIYDMHGQGAVNRDELAALLNHVPTSIMRFGRAVALDPSHDHGHNHHHHHHRDQRRSSGPSLTSHHHQHHQHHHPGHHPRHLPSSSAGSVGRSSPDRVCKSPPPPPRVGLGAMASSGVVSRAAGGVAASAAPAAAAAHGVASESTAVLGSPQSRQAEGMGGVGDGSASPPLLTSGNLMQLDASLSSLVDGHKGGDEPAVHPAEACCGDGGVVVDAAAGGPAGAEAGAEAGAASSSTAGLGGVDDSCGSSPADKERVREGEREGEGLDKGASEECGGGVSSPAAVASMASGPRSPSIVGSGGGGTATAATHAGGHAAEGVSKEGGGGGALSNGGGDAVDGLVLEGGSEKNADAEEEVEVGDSAGMAPTVVPCSAHDAALESAELRVGANGVEGVVGSRSRRGTMRSDSSTDGGVSCAATQHHSHWEDFTNNDIVDQAFEECDLNHNGKLSFNEFRLWVERNPMVTQFLQSVFPYDEHREWGDDRKHLPFIHNREFTASPMRSEPSIGDSENSEDETRRLLIKARNTTRDEGLRGQIDALVEQITRRGIGEGAAAASVGSGDGGGAASPPGSHHGYGGESLRINSTSRSMAGNVSGALLSELSPRSAKVLQNQRVAKQGFLWKQGYRLRTWKQRWYVLVGNCIYHYHHESDVYPSKVMFLTGSFVEPLNEVANERKGFWGIEISRNHEQNHRRKWYTRSKVEQLKWVKELRKASAVVPIEDDYEIGEELGKGRFSRVCMCVEKRTLERKAVKIIMKEDMKPEEKDLLRAEIAIMRLVNHPNIIRMEAVYESKKDIFIVMQLHSGGELFDRIVGRPRFTEDEAFTVIHPLVESVAYLHEMGIVHRDLKPENILCGDRIEDIKIADFGLSKMVMPDEIMKMPCGTLTYVAPEVLTLNGYGKEADIWSVGTIMYLLLRGRLPFDGATREEIIENTIHGTVSWENDHVWASFSEDGKDLVLGMLNKDRSRRYTAKDILAHPWITQRELRREEHPEQFEF